ncbi:hypothetical protein KSP40_PGU001994 [Platanthera guangdongensis]|uniref:Uncharacterized protein n=1 Tax=Platanthera guangdongensis TaxID=2320717 RepID=A0ABR2MMZ1_9ASPA
MPLDPRKHRYRYKYWSLLEKLKAIYLNSEGLPPDRIVPTVGLNIGRIEVSNAKLVLWDLGGQNTTLRLHLVRRWRVDPAGGNGEFDPEGGGGCSKRSFLSRFSRRAGGNGANAAGGSFVYPPSGGVCPKRRSETPKQIEPESGRIHEPIFLD